VYNLNIVNILHIANITRKKDLQKGEEEMKTGQKDEESPTADETLKPSFIHLFSYLMKALVFLSHLLVLSGLDVPMRGKSDV